MPKQLNLSILKVKIYFKNQILLGKFNVKGHVNVKFFYHVEWMWRS